MPIRSARNWPWIGQRPELIAAQEEALLSPARFEDYQRRAAALAYGVVEQPPFVLFFHPRDPLRFFNYAHPLEPVGGDLNEPLALLKATFIARQRLPRFEFVEEYAPDLPAALCAAGFEEEGRYQLMVCTPATYRPALAVLGLEIVLLTPDSQAADIRAYIEVQRRAYDEDVPGPVSDDRVKDFRQRREGTGHAYLARLGGVPSCVGAYMSPLDGLTEIAGIGTLPEYRRRGLASALTARAAEDAFAGGVEIAFLTANDARAGRVYERIGFVPYATGLAYAVPDGPNGAAHNG
jgi:ribosomal protein S18 acetylase RimI-like enzyme